MPRKTKHQQTAKVRRGIGQPFPRSKACKAWPKEPLDCAHEEDQLRQRGSKDSFWWTCLQCGRRWQRVEWEPDQEINQHWSGLFRGIPRFSGNGKNPDLLQSRVPKSTPITEVEAKSDNLGRQEETVIPTDPLLPREDDTSATAVRRATPNAAGAP